MSYSISHDPEVSGKMIINQAIFLALSCSCVSVCPDSDLLFSVIFINYYIFSLLFIWRGNGQRVSPYILFFMTMGLFLGGKFWGYLIDTDKDLFTLDWFAEIDLVYEKKQRLMYYLLSMMGLMNIGYLSRYSRADIDLDEPEVDETFEYRLHIVLRNAMFIIAPLVLIAVYLSFREVSNLGYTVLYEQQDGEYSSFSGLANILMMIALGLVYGYNLNSLKKYYLGLYIIYSIFNILMGARGSFGAMLLFLLLIYSQSHKITGKKLLLFLGSAVFILIIVFSFSARAMEADLMRLGYDSTTDVLVEFISSQGISLMVFDASQLIDSYPALAYVQSIVPGSSFICHLLTGDTIDATDNNFANFMCYSLNPALYKLGFGLGWSIMSDLYLFGFKSFLGFAVLSLIFGGFIGYMEIDSSKSLSMRSIMFATTMALLMLPRSSMNSYITLIIYCVVVIAILKFFLKTEDL